MFYIKTPRNIKYVKDTPSNRIRLREIFGDGKIISKDWSYLEVNVETKEWRNTFTHEWLYRNEPRLTDINTLF